MRTHTPFERDYPPSHTLVRNFQVIAFFKLFLIHKKDQTHHHSHWSLQKKKQYKVNSPTSPSMIVLKILVQRVVE